INYAVYAVFSVAFTWQAKGLIKKLIVGWILQTVEIVFQTSLGLIKFSETTKKHSIDFEGSYRSLLIRRTNYLLPFQRKRVYWNF
ncbi:hypothetical protein X975_01234, partial [Stegodyphus mimosarum]